MIDPSFARDRIAIYHRAMEAKNRGRDRQACLLLREAISRLFGAPEVSPGREQYWWEAHVAMADEAYALYLEAAGKDLEEEAKNRQPLPEHFFPVRPEGWWLADSENAGINDAEKLEQFL